MNDQVNIINIEGGFEINGYQFLVKNKENILFFRVTNGVETPFIMTLPYDDVDYNDFNNFIEIIKGGNKKEIINASIERPIFLKNMYKIINADKNYKEDLVGHIFFYNIIGLIEYNPDKFTIIDNKIVFIFNKENETYWVDKNFWLDEFLKNNISIKDITNSLLKNKPEDYKLKNKEFKNKVLKVYSDNKYVKIIIE